MSDIDVILEAEELLVLGPPSEVTVDYNIGSTGQRGNKWFVGNGVPNETTIPDYNSLITGDMYIDSSNGKTYQYMLLPSNTNDWVFVMTLAVTT